MICEHCAHTARINRLRYRAPRSAPALYLAHNKCKGCACMHKLPEEWGKMFSTEEPREED